MKKIETEKISIPIEGMTCASCVTRVEKAIANAPGVKKVSVNLATEKALVEIDPKEFDFNLIKAAVEESGYKVIVPENSNTINKSSSTTFQKKETTSEYLTEIKKDFFHFAFFSPYLFAF